MRRLIGIMGNNGTGKDTVSYTILYCINKYNIENGNYGINGYGINDIITRRIHIADWKIMKFSEPVKSLLASYLDCNANDLEDRTFKEEHRDKIIAIAEKMKDTSGELWGDASFWVKVLENKYNKCTENVIINDVRFNSEIEFIKKNKGVLISVNKFVDDSIMPFYHIDNTDKNIDKLITKVTAILNQEFKK